MQPEPLELGKAPHGTNLVLRGPIASPRPGEPWAARAVAGGLPGRIPSAMLTASAKGGAN